MKSIAVTFMDIYSKVLASMNEIIDDIRFIYEY